MPDVMIDLETLDTKPSAVILTAGLIKFNPKEITDRSQLTELYIKIQIDDQDKLDRSISEATIKWWQTQAADVQEEAFSDTDRIGLDDAIKQINKFVWNSDRVWSQGSFDINILENLYAQLQAPPPWQFWQVRDSRTLFDFVDGQRNTTTNLHNALEDAAQQALAVQRALDKIQWNGKAI